MNGRPVPRRWRLRAAGLAAVLALAACQPSAPRSGVQGDASHGQTIAQQVCAACHGQDGNGAAPGAPKLSGQFAEYLVKQLKAFNAPPGPTHRDSPVMAPIAAKLTDEDMADVAVYYSSLPRSASTPRTAARVAAGAAIYLHGNPDEDLPACVSCHRPNGQGIEPDFPVIGAQNPDYVEAQLRDWEKTRGHRGKLMSLIVPHLSGEEPRVVADYIATLDPAHR